MASGGKRQRPFVRIGVGLPAALFAVIAGCTAWTCGREGPWRLTHATVRYRADYWMTSCRHSRAQDRRVIKDRTLLAPRKSMGRFSQ